MPTEPPPIAVDELKLGDVLLFRGEQPLDELVMLLDGSEYSHVSLFMGTLDRQRDPDDLGPPDVVDAGRNGVQYYSLEGRAAAEAQCDVFRWTADGSTFEDGGPILAVGAHYQENQTQYAWNQLILTALLLVSRNVPRDEVYLAILAGAVWLLDQWQKDGKTTVTCSDLVYRCFDEAEPTPSYRVPGVTQRVLSSGRTAVRAAGAALSSRGSSSLDFRLPSRSDLEKIGDAIKDGDVGKLNALVRTLGASTDGVIGAVLQTLHEEGSRNAALELARLMMDPDLAGKAERKLIEALSGERGSAASKTGSDVITEFITPGDLADATGLLCMGRLTIG